MSKPNLIPLPPRESLTDEELLARAKNFYADMARRRTVRDFSERPVPRELIETCLRTAGSAPNGANLQPWHFVAVSDPALKREIRIAAETEEREFYEHRAPNEWLEALAKLGTDAHKPFLEIAPWLIAIFAQPYRILPDGRKLKHYYAIESVGIATGLLVGGASGRSRLAHAHTEPHGFLEQAARSARLREAVSASRDRSSRRRRKSARHSAQATGRDQLVCVARCSAATAKLERETQAGTDHSEVVLVAVHHVPAEIVDDPKVRRQAQFDSRSELTHSLRVVVMVKVTKPAIDQII